MAEAKRQPVPLGRLMEERRRELGLTWREVAAAAGSLTYETLRSVRYGDTEPRGLTRDAIDRGLRWQLGSTEKFLESGTAPVPLDGPVALQGVTDPEEAERQEMIAAVRKMYPGDAVAEAIMTQWQLPLEVRQRELRKVQASLDAAAQAQA